MSYKMTGWESDIRLIFQGCGALLLQNICAVYNPGIYSAYLSAIKIDYVKTSTYSAKK